MPRILKKASHLKKKPRIFKKSRMAIAALPQWLSALLLQYFYYKLMFSNPKFQIIYMKID
jgi:hypothetical protein